MVKNTNYSPESENAKLKSFNITFEWTLLIQIVYLCIVTFKEGKYLILHMLNETCPQNDLNG